MLYVDQDKEQVVDMRRAIFLLVCLFATTFLSTTLIEAAPESDSAQVNDEEFKQIRDQYNHCSMGQRGETIALIDALLSKIKHTDSKESLEQTISLFEMKILLYRSLRDWDSWDKAILTLTELIKLKEINSNDGKAAASDYDSLAGMLTEKIYHFDGLYNGCVQTRKEKEISKERANKAKAELHKLCKKMLLLLPLPLGSYPTEPEIPEKLANNFLFLDDRKNAIKSLEFLLKSQERSLRPLKQALSLSTYLRATKYEIREKERIRSRLRSLYWLERDYGSWLRTTVWEIPDCFVIFVW